MGSSMGDHGGKQVFSPVRHEYLEYIDFFFFFNFCPSGPAPGLVLDAERMLDSC